MSRGGDRGWYLMPGRPISTSELPPASTCRFAADETLLAEAASQTRRSPGYMQIVNSAFDARMRLLGKAPHSVHCRARNWVLEASPSNRSAGWYQLSTTCRRRPKQRRNELGNSSKANGQRRWRELLPPPSGPSLRAELLVSIMSPVTEQT